MFGEIGIEKLLLLFGVVLLVFGAGRPPEIGASLGRGIQEFRRGTAGVTHAPSDGAERDERVGMSGLQPGIPARPDGIGDRPRRLTT